MSIVSSMGRAFRATELDAFRPSSIVTSEKATKWTERNNLGNAAMYAANAASPVTGIVNAIVCLGKFSVAMVAMMAALGSKGERQQAQMNLAADCMKSGLENALVGAAACIPFYGTYLAGTMALRSIGDAANVQQTIKALPAPKAD